VRSFEKVCIGLRHAAPLKNATWLWNILRPIYDSVVRILAPAGLERVINGTDRVLVLPELRGISETYEPEVWRRVMTQLQSDDTFVDVGAFFGFYTIAAARRAGRTGRVLAFEPVPSIFDILKKHIALNAVQDVVEAHCCAVGEHDGDANFACEHSCQSHILPDGTDSMKVPIRSLDSVLKDRRADIIKVDVEGFEEMVLRGATTLLNDRARRPRAIFIEVHPYNWHRYNTTSESLLRYLRMSDYEVKTLEGTLVSYIDGYGEIIATARNSKQ
jgi:FkbM family methyltransferase